MKAKGEAIQRFLTPDVCRGVAIFLVIWGHVLQQGLQCVVDVSENGVFRVIYSFHMPLFSIISGYFFYNSQKKKNFRELVLTRSCRLIVVIVIWNTIHYICSLILDAFFGLDVVISLRDWLTAVSCGYWFLWAVLFCTIVVGVAVKKLPERFWMMGFVLFIPLILVSPCRWVILSIYPFFIAGFMYNKMIDSGKQFAPWIQFMAILVYIVGMMFYFSIPYIGNSEWKPFLEIGLAMLKGLAGFPELIGQATKISLYYVLGSTGSIAIITIIEVIAEKFKNNAVTECVARLGKYSLQVYILQRILVELILGRLYQEVTFRTGNNIIYGNTVVFTFVYSLAIAIICTGIIYCIVRYVFCEKISKLLFGR